MDYIISLYIPYPIKKWDHNEIPGLAHGDSLQSSRCVNKSYPYATGQV